MLVKPKLHEYVELAKANQLNKEQEDALNMAARYWMYWIGGRNPDDFHTALAFLRKLEYSNENSYSTLQT